MNTDALPEINVGHRWTAEDAQKASQRSNWAKTLTDAQTQEIYQQNKAGISERQLARAWCVSRTTIHRIIENFSQQGDSMNPVDMEKVRTILDKHTPTIATERKLSDEQVAVIREQLALGRGGRRLAQEYNVSDSTITKIKYGYSPYQKKEPAKEKAQEIGMPLTLEEALSTIADNEWNGHEQEDEILRRPSPAPITLPRMRLEDIQLYTTGEDISIESLFQSRHIYRFPDFQREFVWTLTDEQLLVDSALRTQFYIPPFDIFEEMTEEGPIRWMNDGGQRFRSLMWFRENRFPTLSEEQFKRIDRNSGLPLIEPNRLFAEMTVMAQNTFKIKTLHLMVTRSHNNASFGQIKPLLAERFRRYCHQRRLNVAEKLWTYPSEAKIAAEEISHHAVWADIYQTRGDKRRQKFEIGLIVLALFLKNPPATIRTTELEDIASGMYDAYLTKDLLESIHLFLDRLHHVFYNARAVSAFEVIPMIQACRTLEQEGYSLDQSEKGCLTGWLFQARSRSKLSHLGQVKAQVMFWSIQHDLLLQQPGLVKSRKEDEATALPFRFEREQ